MPDAIRPPRLLTAYFLGQHMYTLVPRHVREDFQWMADIGTQAVAIAVLENDLKAAGENIRILCREAEAVGMKVFAVPARWGGLFAGVTKVPSIFTANHPETWMLHRDSTPIFSPTWGPMSSVHHPSTFDFFRRSLDRLLSFPFAGIIWDEPKAVVSDEGNFDAVLDFSAAARAKMAAGAGQGDRDAEADGRWHIDAFADFVACLNAHARSLRPELVLSMFAYGHLRGYALDRLAAIDGLDYFGCDGRPWALADLPVPATGEFVKALLDQGPSFLEATRRNGKGGLMLIENQAVPAWGYPIVDRRLPDVLALNAEHLLYYYYPRNLPDPDAMMAIIARMYRGLRNARQP